MNISNEPITEKNNSEDPLYNSLLIKNYIVFMEEHYPDVDVGPILEYAGITKYELEDQGHWLTQKQVDRFHEKLVEKTDNSKISREVGRYSASPKVSSALRQYLLGFSTPSSVYRMLNKHVNSMSKHFKLHIKKISKGEITVTAIPNPGVEEKPYQCENRIGLFEAIPRLFNLDYADIKHPACYHKGDHACKYIISWQNAASLKWKLVRNYGTIIGMLFTIPIFLFLPTTKLLIWLLSFVLSIFALSMRFYQLNIKELGTTLEKQGDVASDLLEEMDIRHQNALLVQEIGHAISTILNINELVKEVAGIMERRLKFDRGMIMLCNEEKTHLVYTAGYGYNKDNEGDLTNIQFSLENPTSKGMAVQTFYQQKPFQVNDISQLREDLSKKSMDFINNVGSRSFICVPIVYENESLGIFAVDNGKSNIPLTQSDINLLMGVASQTAVSIVNAMSFQRLRDSEEKYRDLVENANSIILRMDTNGNLIFFNEFAQKFFGYTDKEILGRNIIDTIMPKSDKKDYDMDFILKDFLDDTYEENVHKRENILRNGDSVWIAWTFKPIFLEDQLTEILCIGNDITDLERAMQEKEDLQAQLLVSQKMEALGTLAGGIAHDFNNILQAIFSNIQILTMRHQSDDPEYKKILSAVDRSVQNASELTKRLLILGRKVESKLRPLDITQVIDHVIKMLERTIPKMIMIDKSFAHDLKPINADPAQIEQILINLAINARDAMPEGGDLVIRAEFMDLGPEYCSNHLDLKPGKYVRLSVSDTGHGMEAEVLEHIFEPFYTTKGISKGTGLGLSIVYGIVKSHEAHILCDSKPGQGSVFNIYFKALESDSLVADFNEEKHESIESGKGTILLIDDEKSIRDPTEIILKNFGYKVIPADDGTNALRLFKEKYQDIDIILLDLIMPGMGGEKCLEEIIKIDPDAKVIIISGHSPKEEKKKKMEKYTQKFMAKPYNPKELHKVIKKILNDD